jgi:hypothetical protein
MTESLSPITPPPELVQQWSAAAPTDNGIATQAAQWGADVELEACCQWFSEFYRMETWVERDLITFKTSRRPKKPTSLKQKALEALKQSEQTDYPIQLTILNTDSHVLIRKALEALPDNL